ncbi:His/Glu/Gln/Arg/opine family amino ABC transporter, permease, 3-TM region [Paenisporosarcina sp. HGH0030]|uniref:amino acid ABC transporter permease n=1 Tax=Paenisporosarcina sp. HGH0030 TaxID=1078085 RepID=UPI00034E6991|nr:amino acid ABC transporter permease [Paenisporosarcina sp. HGH0030]EPD53121.1 His/Glu/Gln/Arg/opine family amino ABC transporter, permease, 3-TM region [Paenisporosarcina sp. HGH0030]
MNEIEWGLLFDPQLALDSFPYVLSGIWYTLLIAIVSMVVGLIIGFFIALARTSNLPFLQWPARLYISFMRGVPILVILFLLYFGFPVIGVEFTAMQAALIGFSLNSAAYMAEILRSSLSSVDIGQWESSKALGLTYWQSMRRIILPQSVRIAVPPLSNVLMDLIKASSLAAMITVPEMFQKARSVGAREYDLLTLLILVALMYWAICSVMTVLQNYLEKRYAKYL